MQKHPLKSAVLFMSLWVHFVLPGWCKELPLGDGRISTAPERGSVFACEQSFGGRGAQLPGPWIHGIFWNPDQKTHVQGKVAWPSAKFNIRPEEHALKADGNGLPVGQPTGVFPIQENDPVFRYDRNPNTIQSMGLRFDMPLHPQKALLASCLPQGMIGISTHGVALYNALDDAGRDAAAHEVQDLCAGHPQEQGQYHQHSGSPCHANFGTNALVGWALDGYPILGMRDVDGRLLANNDLDDCHGRQEQVEVDGRHYDYAYRLTAEYPYTLGCYRGKLDPTTRPAIDAALPWSFWRWFAAP